MLVAALLVETSSFSPSVAARDNITLLQNAKKLVLSFRILSGRIRLRPGSRRRLEQVLNP